MNELDFFVMQKTIKMEYMMNGKPSVVHLVECNSMNLCHEGCETLMCKATLYEYILE